MINRYINSFLLLLLAISLVVINSNQENVITTEEEIIVNKDEAKNIENTMITNDSSITTTTAPTTSTTSSTTTTTAPTTTTTSSTTTTTAPTTSTTSSTTTTYIGPFSSYAGFEGLNQSKLEQLSMGLPELLLDIIDTNNISIINGCHQYGKLLIERCPYGVWDQPGTSSDGSKNAEWSFSIWISNRAFEANVAYDVLLHESLHAFSYSTRNCATETNNNYRQEARNFFGGEEYLVDALVLYYGGSYNHYRTLGGLTLNEQEYLTKYITSCTS